MRVLSERLRGLRVGAAPGLLAVVTALAVVLPAAGATAAPKPPPAATSDRVKAWGVGDFGQLGDGIYTGRITPITVPGLTRADVQAISAGSGNGAFVPASGPGAVPTDRTDGEHVLALLRNHTVEAWGNDDHGQLGDGTTGTVGCTFTAPATVTRCNGTPGTVAGLINVIAVAAGGSHSLALLKNGTIMAWGANSHGQLGIGGTSTADKLTPVPVVLPASAVGKVVAVAAGDSHSLALLKNGTVLSWGINDHGQLGQTASCPCTTTDVFAPAPVVNLGNVGAIAVGASHNLAMLKDGSVKAWGRNASDQVGVIGPLDQPVVPVTSLGTPGSGVKAIAAGADHSLALLKDGSVRAWGRDDKGQLGAVTSPAHSDQFTPVTPTGLGSGSGVKVIAGGGFHSLALLKNGAVLAWGDNDYGQLGDGSKTGRDTPVFIKTGLTGKTIVTGGAYYSLAG